MSGLLLVAVGAQRLPAQESEVEFTPKLLIAFSGYHPRPKYPTIYFYQHDGKAQGKVFGSIAVSGKRSDSHASLSHDGRYCAFASEEENNTSKVRLWDRAEKKLVDLPDINKTPHAQLHASLSGNGKFMAFAAWSHPEAQGRWDVLLYDIAGRQRLPLASLNTQPQDERMPALSADGSALAFTSNAEGGKGLTDIYFYDVASAQVTHDAKLNSPRLDIEPALSADGNLVAFSSDRPGGQGGRDIYLYDREKQRFLPLPGLNYVAQEQTPSLSPDGRFIAFVSERLAGEGERDIFLYDRTAGKLLPTPGLNSKHEDLDPCVVVLVEQE